MGISIDRARELTNDPRVFGARTANVHSFFIRSFVDRKRPSSRFAIADTLSHLARYEVGDEGARANGWANLIGGRPEEAAVELERISSRDANDWTDLAAAHICAARGDAAPDHWLAALAAADRALSLAPASPEARFDRATAIDAMGTTPTAREEWTRYLRQDTTSPWSAVAKQHVAAFVASDSAAWREGTSHFELLPAAELTRLTRSYPEMARRYADAVYLSAWAVAAVNGDRITAEAHLARVGVIARELANRRDLLIGDALAAIANADGDRSRTRPLIDGQLAYQRGRLRLRDHDPVDAERELRVAVQQLAKGGSAMAEVAQFWTGVALTEQNRTDDAREILTVLLTRQSSSGSRYRSLIGQIQYQLSVLEAQRGNWSRSLAAAQSARALLASLGERGYVGNADAVLAEDYDLLGQSQLAWRYGFAALRETAAAGALDRTRVTLAALCRTELRGGRWDRARSLTSLEQSLAPQAPDLRLDPDMFIRRAAAEWHLGQIKDAARSVTLARTAALRLDDPAIRTKLLADVDAAEGAFIRRSDPHRAIALLSGAVAFEEASARSIVLPELFLERGRAFLSENNLDAAEADFGRGLTELEHQRSRVRDAELRPGIFSDSSELFDEAIALQVRKKTDLDAILSYVERGRARALLEQMTASTDPMVTPSLPTVEGIQQALPPSTALLEYVALPDRLCVFVIRRELAVMRVLPVARGALMQAVGAFTNARGAHGDRLYETLIAPIRNDLQGVTSLDIVGDDALEQIPFAALFDPKNGTFLVQKYVIATSPSAGVLLATMARLRSQPPKRTLKALIFANPAIPAELSSNLPSLDAAEQETASLIRSYVRPDVFTGQTATAQRFCELAPAADVVHFAGHAVVNVREPYASALICASTHDFPGALTARAIAHMRFRSTRAVVLAACKTMTGRRTAIEGVPTLARAFVVGGVPAVIGTLWDVEDSQATAITSPLHERLGRGIAPAEALQAVQVVAIQGKQPVSSWSAFSLMGSTAALQSSSR